MSPQGKVVQTYEFVSKQKFMGSNSIVYPDD